ncbi:MAG: hypothetical protein N2511_04485 [Thermodesulfovibrionales bacterium]|nr:hypothetical protein [Thermodesulfovibrionales bacterium]
MRRDKPLYIAFLWHFHQPIYKDPQTGIYRLPWVRLHGVKDYLDMVTKVEKFPSLRLTFNIVPSLIEQLRDYVEKDAKDIYMLLTLKNPSDLSEAEKLFILENFFLANWDNMIKPYPRYYQLLQKRGFRFTKKDLAKIARYFTENDIRDLQVLFNLCWIDPILRESDPFLKSLVQKGKDFNEDEKVSLIEKHKEILKQILPTYKRIMESGQVEFSVSPFYHPILPLLWDTNIAKVSMPDIVLPKRRFSYPEDAQRQINMAIQYFEDIFGIKPLGMWPSEGSVSMEIVDAIRSSGIRWVATDEEVLARSLSKPLRDSQGTLVSPSELYKPYNYNGVSIIFRDHILSDLIGFSYSGWNTESAVRDFIHRLSHIKNSLADDQICLVPIILDGENAWEYYVNDGNDFLDGIYKVLTEDERFKTVKISEFLEEFGYGESLTYLHPGSWINANFKIWIGHEEDNLAWDYLTRTRDDLASFSLSHPEKDLTEAWEAIYAAEGSDWNWWYGDEHVTETQEDFDELFRSYLIKVYESMGLDAPHYLYVPIKIEARSIQPQIEPRGFIYPKIDGVMTSYFEWYLGAFVDVKRSGGSMHKSESLISGIYYGFNKDNLYIRIDPTKNFKEIEGEIIFRINILQPMVAKIVFNPTLSKNAFLHIKDNGKWVCINDNIKAAVDHIFEVEIAFKDIYAKENEEIQFYIELFHNGKNGYSEANDSTKKLNLLDRCPWRGFISVTVPTPYFESLMWY